jgi:hypothetical protein
VILWSSDQQSQSFFQKLQPERVFIGENCQEAIAQDKFVVRALALILQK